MSEPDNAPRILLVEDDDATAELERLALVWAGLEVRRVRCVADAIDQLQLESFRVVVLDDQLPDGDPWRVVRAAHAQTPRVPVIIVTAMGNERVAAEALQQGVAEYLPRTEAFWNQLPGSVERVTKTAKIDERLRRTDALFRLIEESATDLIATIDLHGTIRQMSNALSSMLGYQPEDVLGKQSIDYVHPDDRARVASAFAARPEQARLTYRQRRKDGSFVWVEVNASIVRDKTTGAPQEVLGVIRDITERKRAEDKFRALLEGSPEANVIVDHAGIMVLMNARTEQLFGYDRRELLGRPVDTLLPERLRSLGLWRRARHPVDVAGGAASPTAASSPTRASVTHEICGVRKDGSEFPAELSLNWLETEGEVLISSTIIDISHRKTIQDQELLLTMGRELPRFDDVAALVSYVVTTIGQYLDVDHCMFMEIDWANATAMTHADYARDTALTPGVYPLTGYALLVREELGAGRAIVIADTAVDARTVPEYATSYQPWKVGALAGVPLTRNGVWVAAILAFTAQPRAWAAREVQMLQALGERTWLWMEHVRMLRALRDSEGQYRRLIESTHEGVWDIDEQLKTRFVNGRMAEMLGYTVAEMLGKPLGSFTDEQGLALTDHIVERRKAGVAESLDFKFLRKDGVPVWARLEASPQLDASGKYIGSLAMVADVTERKLNEQDQQFLLDLAELLTVTNDADAATQAVASRLGAHLGADSCHFSEINPDDPSITIRHEWQRTQANSVVGSHSLAYMGVLLQELHTGRSVVVTDTRRDPRTAAEYQAGKAFARVAAMLVVPMHKEGRWTACLSLLTVTPRAWTRREIALVHATVERTSLCVERLQSIAALRDFNRDLEQRVEDRTSELKAALREKEVLIKEIHHRVKNNLQVISSMLNLQALHLPDAEARSMFAESQGRVQSIALVHESLYQSKDLSSVSFVEYLRSLVSAVFQAQSTPGGRIEAQVDAAEMRLPVAIAIPCGLIVNELVTNALKHAFPGRREGKIRVRLRRCDDDRVELTVADDGVGLPEDQDPSRAKSLGLDLVYTFAEQLGAEVRVRRESGTEFVLTFRDRED
jgi:PAS domain S-box-containing protein